MKRRAAHILLIDDDSAVLDKNHPLAGKHLVYKVNILEVT